MATVPPIVNIGPGDENDDNQLATVLFDGTANQPYTLGALTDNEYLFRSGGVVSSRLAQGIDSQDTTTTNWVSAVDGSNWINIDEFDPDFSGLNPGELNTFSARYSILAQRTDGVSVELLDAILFFGINVESTGTCNIPNFLRSYNSRDTTSWQVRVAVNVGSPRVVAQFRNTTPVGGETITIKSQRVILQKILNGV